MSKLTVEVTGTNEQVAAALRDLAERVLAWGDDHAPMGHRGHQTVAPYTARWDDWEYDDLPRHAG